MSRAPVMIVDYGMGNLFSVRRACEHVGLSAEIGADPARLGEAPAVILPGVGAFGEAMAALRGAGLIDPLRDYAASGGVVLGVCLGMQLLMESSDEFGDHQGLGLIPGGVRRLNPVSEGGRVAKVPHIGWNGVHPSVDGVFERGLLAGLEPGAQMYFVHSYHVQPSDPADQRLRTRYAGREFCSALARGRVWGVQFHPERSGPAGLRIYRNLAGLIGDDNE